VQQVSQRNVAHTLGRRRHFRYLARLANVHDLEPVLERLLE